MEYLGVGESLDEKFEKMKVEATYDDLTGHSSLNAQVYTGIPLSSNPICPFTLHLYPSELMEDEFRSDRPLLYAILTICMFMVAAITMYAYDYLVEKRKKNLMRTARKTDAIVSNMLPANVRDILYQKVSEDDQSITNEDDDDDNGVNSMFKGGTIADLYPNATIVFADISRFTAWSSTREPTQVFHLLEVGILYVKVCTCLILAYRLVSCFFPHRLYMLAGTRLLIDTMSQRSKPLEVRT